MAERDNTAPDSAELHCPRCETTIGIEGSSIGRPLRCPGCESWMFRRASVSSDRRSSRCGTCRAPLPLDDRRFEPCGVCGTEAMNQRGLLGRLWSRFKRRDAIQAISLRQIRAGELQPRLSIDVERFENLRGSLDAHGMLVPITVVSSRKTKQYDVVSGHRRVLAARDLGWPSVPSRVLTVTAEEAARIRLVENLHREPLSALEIAEAVERCFLVSDVEERRALAESLQIVPERLDAWLSLLQATPPERESWIYGELSALPKSPVDVLEIARQVNRESDRTALR